LAERARVAARSASLAGLALTSDLPALCLRKGSGGPRPSRM